MNKLLFIRLRIKIKFGFNWNPNESTDHFKIFTILGDLIFEHVTYLYLSLLSKDIWSNGLQREFISIRVYVYVCACCDAAMVLCIWIHIRVRVSDRLCVYIRFHVYASKNRRVVECICLGFCCGHLVSEHVFLRVCSCVCVNKL